MKVAILVQYPLDPGNLLGGVEAAITYMLPELCKIEGLDLHVITCREDVDRARTAGQGCARVSYLPRGRWGRITWHIREVHSILDALHQVDPDMVHAHGTGLYAGAALASGRPAVTTVHGIMGEEARLFEGWRRKLRGWLDTRYERSVVRRAPHLISISPYVQQVFAGLFRGQAYLVENACDQRFFDLKREPTPGRLLFAGMVIPRKGVLPLLRAVDLLRASHPSVCLRIAGSMRVLPAYARACEDYVNHAGLGATVTFLGQLSQEDLMREYAQCAAFVLPAFQETAPVVIAQAMAAGVPSVTTRAGGVPWMIEDGVTGWTLPVPTTMDGDPRALADALRTALADDGVAAQVGARARQAATGRFHPSIVAQRTYDVYQQVLRLASPAPRGG